MDSFKICGALYSETEQFWTRINFQPKYGFKILNGPPIRNAEILFVGYQPGGGEKAAQEEREISVHNGTGTHIGWPLVCEYATAKWDLAPKMQRVFGKDRLKRCVGTNVIFLRYPKAACYRSHVGERRKLIEQFCKERLKSIIEAINPKRIITIGFKTLEMFGPTETELLRDNGKHALTKKGQIANRSAVGVIHLTGAWPSNAEMDRLADHFRT